MKFDERRLPDLLSRVGSFRVVLVYGDDAVLVAERARDVAARAARESYGLVAPVHVDGGDHVRIVDEARSPVLGGGLRLIRLRFPTDSASSSVEAVLGEPEGVLVLIEAGALTARSRLRALVEGSSLGASVSCWASEGRDLPVIIERLITGRGYRIEPDARALLVERADGYGAALDDAEKLMLLRGEAGDAIRVSDVRELDQDSGVAGIDELASAVATGLMREADRLLEKVLQDQTTAGGVLRGLLGYFSRLRMIRLAIDRGMPADRAVAALRPPVFFLRASEMASAASRWSARDLDQVCVMVWRAEMASRETGSPMGAIIRRAVWMIVGMSPRRQMGS